MNRHRIKSLEKKKLEINPRAMLQTTRHVIICRLFIHIQGAFGISVGWICLKMKID